MKKKYLAVAVALVLLMAALLPGCSSAPASAPTEEPVKLRVAVADGLWGYDIASIENHKGFFKEQGLEIEWLKIPAGPSVVAALLSGDLQIGFTGPGGHTSCADGSVEVISLDFIGNNDTIIVRKDSGINTLKDLEGHTIAAQLGTSGEILINLVCEAEGVDKEKLDIINMDMTGCVTAFLSGKVDAIATFGVYAQNIHEQLKNETVELCRVADYRDRSAILGSFIATPAYIQENPDIVNRFLLGLYACQQFRYENMDQVIEFCAEDLEQEVSVIAADRDNGVAFSVEELKDQVENGELMTYYTNQLEYFVDTETVTEVKVQPEKYVRIDLMQKAFEDYFK